MKYIVSIVAALIAGIACGWLAHGAYHPKPKPFDESQQKDWKELAKLYPDAVALHALKDMRVVVSLDTNVSMARSLLVQDLDIQVSTLSALSSESLLSDFNTHALTDTKAFLDKSK